MKARAAWVLAVALVLPGCINLGLGAGGKKPDMHRHTVDVATGVAQRTRTAPGLAVRPFGARLRYDVRVVRREGAEDFAYLEYERWGDAPADAATDAVREGLAASGAFAFVSSAGDAIAVERFLDGYVLAFDLVKTPTGPWKARFAARLSLSDRAGKMLASGVYDATRDLPGASPEGLGGAMSAAIGDALNRAVKDWDAVAAPK
jgi:ABC-type uncharacterized transport system auxiliary subunit